MKKFAKKGAWVPPIISGTGKVMNFKFCLHIYRLNRNKSPLKISGKVAVGVRRDSRAVMFAIARLSCLPSVVAE